MGALLEIVHSTVNGIAVLEPMGDITRDTEEFLENAYLEIRPDIKEVLVIDFENVRYVNSTGLKLLIRIIDDNMRNGVETRFCAVAKSVMKVMNLVGISDHVNIFPGKEEATTY